MWGVLLSVTLASVNVARGPLRLEDFRNGRGELDGAPAVRGFVQRVPSDGKPASQRTDVYLGFDDTNLYAVFVCFDDEPERVRARMLPRGTGILDYDYVAIQLDTFRDQRRAYVFSANPLGVQNTAMWIEGESMGETFDTLLAAAANFPTFLAKPERKSPFLRPLL